MIQSLWTYFKGLGSATEEATLDEGLLALVIKSQSASELRETLRDHAKLPLFMSKKMPALVEKLYSLSWSPVEIEKVQAYGEFFSGASANAYQRVVTEKLARNDYMLFMTACLHCYQADRFVEGAALLDMFQPEEDPATDWCEYWAYAGYIYVAAGRPLAQALTFFDKAFQRCSFSPMLAVNGYHVYFEAGRLENCQTIRELIQRHCPNDPEALFALGYVELARDYYGEGFRLMEARHYMPEAARSMNATLLQHSRWTGENIAGKRLLVHGEQGLGDMVMMARYLPVLQAQGIELLMDGQSEALSLMAHNFPYCHFIVANLKQPIPEPFDYWIGLMSLPHRLQTTAINAPSTNGYLSVPDDHRQYWHDRIQEHAAIAKLRVGLTWSGNPAHKADKRRSMPFDRVLPLLLAHPDIRFFSIQTHVPKSHPANLIDIADELLTMADTAAVIMEMDLVISVDTSAIHLAGALGCRAWLLLPHRYEWRWGLEGVSNAWYSSVKVWRQRQPGAWPELIEQVSQALIDVKTVGGN